MSNKTFDFLKYTAFIAPIISFLAKVVEIWGIPYGDQIITTLTALSATLSAIVLIANKLYKNKTIDPETVNNPDNLEG